MVNHIIPNVLVATVHATSGRNKSPILGKTRAQLIKTQLMTNFRGSKSACRNAERLPHLIAITPSVRAGSVIFSLNLNPFSSIYQLCRFNPLGTQLDSPSIEIERHYTNSTLYSVVLYCEIGRPKHKTVVCIASLIVVFVHR